MPNPFKQGQHICALYETEEEQRAIAAEYLADGLRKGERCFYVARSRIALAQFHQALTSFGIDVDEAVGSGALHEATHAEAHLQGGRFDCERMLRLLNDAVEDALNDGFTGLRTCGDMSWLLDEAQGSGQVVEYEGLLNEFFREVRASGMCQYDRQRLLPALIDHALATHSTALLEGQHRPNPFFKQQT